jgi:hypothetical protein
VPLQKVVPRARLSREDWECLIRFAQPRMYDAYQDVGMMRPWDSADMGGRLQVVLESSVNEYADAMRPPCSDTEGIRPAQVL